MLDKDKAVEFLKALAILSRKHGIAIGLAHCESEKMPFLVGLEEEFQGHLYTMNDRSCNIHGRKQYTLVPRLCV